MKEVKLFSGLTNYFKNVLVYNIKFKINMHKADN